MRCPVCPDTVLELSNRSGIEIDYCPACRGVWLDRGELDKLIEREQEHIGRDARDDREAGSEDDDREGSRSRFRGFGGDKGGKKRKESFLSDFFDFG